MTTVTYDAEDMRKHTLEFKNKFEILQEFGKIEDIYGYKLGHYGGILYINPNTLFQPVSRWWYEESRDKLWKYLKYEFGDYIALLDMISTAINFPLLGSKDYKIISNIQNDNREFIKAILPGLYKLKKIYQDYKDLENTLDYILLPLTTYINAYEGI